MRFLKSRVNNSAYQGFENGNSRDTIPIRPTTNQVLCPQNTPIPNALNSKNSRFGHWDFGWAMAPGFVPECYRKRKGVPLRDSLSLVPPHFWGRLKLLSLPQRPPPRPAQRQHSAASRARYRPTYSPCTS